MLSLAEILSSLIKNKLIDHCLTEANYGEVQNTNTETGNLY